MSPKTKYILAGVTLFVVIVGISLVLGLLLQGDEDSEREEHIKAVCDESNLSPIGINTCERTKCTFDDRVCEDLCPFDYVSDETGCQVSCECADDGTYQGDVRFLAEDVMELAEMYGFIDPDRDFDVFYGSTKEKKHLWMMYPKNNRYQIPFTMSKDIGLRSLKEGVIKSAMQSLMERTCIDFVKRTDEKYYLTFVVGNRCSSMIGTNRKAGQEVTIGAGCDHLVIVQHELMHAIGVHHEQCRPDRDAYVTVMEENVKKDYFHRNFRKMSKDAVPMSKSPYDIESIMHYSSKSYVKKEGTYGVVERGTEKLILRSTSDIFTEYDEYDINAAYGCVDEEPGAEWSTWAQWSYCDITCGKGEKYRYRRCENSAGKLVDGCYGEKYYEKEDCDSGVSCPPPDQWLPWGNWNPCLKTCGSSIQYKSRKCSGNACKGKLTQVMRVCKLGSCSAEVTIKKEWGDWSSCFATCEGKRIREERCLATYCPDLKTESESCNTAPCSEEKDNMGQWGEWGICNDDCSKSRKRQCRDANWKLGQGCPPNAEEYEYEDKSCNTDKCATKAPEAQWTECSKSCGGGVRTRNKMCGKKECPENQKCNEQKCEGDLGIWQKWEPCNNLCTQERRRTCRDSNNKPVSACGYNPKKHEYQNRPCNTEKCVDSSSKEWGSWSTCSATCEGIKIRTRNCQTVGCTKEEEDSKLCNTELCDAESENENDSLFEVEAEEVDENLCGDGSSSKLRWYFGDFNGDKINDALCFASDGSVSLGHARANGSIKKMHWKGAMPKCIDSENFIGDFNGDGKADILCRNYMNKRLIVKYANTEGIFDTTDIDGGDFCTGTDDKLMILDLDNSNTMDLLCHFPDKHIEVRLNAKT